MQLIHDLVKLANFLDDNGLNTLANQIDHTLLKLSMTREQAARLLDISPYATPEAINRAFKHKALKYHPDVGGSAEKMIKLNIARDVLLGRDIEERPFMPPTTK